jgi:hypothetical protein
MGGGAMPAAAGSQPQGDSGTFDPDEIPF